MTILHVAVDLETMGKDPGCALMSLGAAFFTLGNPPNDDTTFYHNIDLQSCVDVGLNIDPSTVYWWMEQGAQARSAISNRAAAHNVRKVLHAFNSWITGVMNSTEAYDVMVWGFGALSDNAWLREAYRACGIEPVWQFRNDLCLRTLATVIPWTSEKSKPRISHHARYDALSQADWLYGFLTYLNGLDPAQEAVK